MALSLNLHRSFEFRAFMVTFMTMALPFAILLFIWVRKKISGRRTILLLIGIMFAAPVTFATVLTLLFESEHLRFIRQDPAYYVRFSQACGLLLQQHSIGTNQSLEIALTHSSVPRVIRDLHPSDIKVWPRGLEMRIHLGDRANFYGVSWFHDEEASNVWRLEAGGGEAPEPVVYAVTNF
jgi:hypothetical protein